MITTLLISYTPIQKIRKDVQVIKNSKRWKWCWQCWGEIVTLFEGQGLPFKVHRWSIESLKRYHWKSGGGLDAKLCPILATPWTVACRAPLSMGFPRQEYWNGLPFPSPGNLSNTRIKPMSLALAGGSFPTGPPGTLHMSVCVCYFLWQQCCEADAILFIF